MQNTPQGGAPDGAPQQQGRYPGGQAARPWRPKWWYWAGGGAVAIVLCCGGLGIASLAGHPSTGGESGNGAATATSQSAGGVSGKSRTPAATTTATHAPQWTTVQQFSGTTSQKTPLFRVPNEWRIVWTCKKADEFGGNFIVNVMNADGTPLDYAAVNTQDDDGATTYEHQGGGQVYLDVQTYSEQWNIQVQVQE